MSAQGLQNWGSGGLTVTPPPLPQVDKLHIQNAETLHSSVTRKNRQDVRDVQSMGHR